MRLWIAQGKLSQASRIVQESGITTHDEIPCPCGPEFLALLRLLLALGEAIGPLPAIIISNYSTPRSMFMISSFVGIAMAFTAMIVLQGTRRQYTSVKVTQSSRLATEAIK